jgi:hypothetical protein
MRYHLPGRKALVFLALRRFVKSIIPALQADCKDFSKSFLGFQKFCLTTAFSMI